MYRHMCFPAFVLISTTKIFAGSFSALAPDGVQDDHQLSIIYDARTGETAVDPPAQQTFLRSIALVSEAGIFTGPTPQNILSGPFDMHTRDSLFKICFPSDCVEFSAISFGPVSTPGLSEDFVLQDITAFPSSSRGVVEYGPVDLLYIPVPEPSAILLGIVGAGLLALRSSTGPGG